MKQQASDFSAFIRAAGLPLRPHRARNRSLTFRPLIANLHSDIRALSFWVPGSKFNARCLRQSVESNDRQIHNANP
jgi:hypothetical protein